VRTMCEFATSAPMSVLGKQFKDGGFWDVVGIEKEAQKTQKINFELNYQSYVIEQN